MRLSEAHVRAIRQIVRETAGEQARVSVFGSRVNDRSRGGDLDLLIDLPVPVDAPALLSARLAARVSRALAGRRVDVLISAPNLAHLPIHDIARETGTAL